MKDLLNVGRDGLRSRAEAEGLLEAPAARHSIASAGLRNGTPTSSAAGRARWRRFEALALAVLKNLLYFFSSQSPLRLKQQ